MNLTDISIRKLPLPEKNQKIYFDSKLPGFGVRCSTKSKSFVVVYGKKRQIKTIGRFNDNEWTLADARKEAKRLLAHQPTHRNIMGYTGAVESFLEDCQVRNRPETIRQYRNYLTRLKTRKRVAAYSTESCHPFHAKAATQTGAKLPPIGA